MDLSSIIHEPKSAYSYAYDINTLHLRIRTKKNEVDKIEVLAVDPFNWVPRGEGSLEYEFEKDSVSHITMIKEQVTESFDCWFAEVKDIKWGRTKYCFILENDKEKIIYGSHDRLPYTEKDCILYNLFNYYNYPYINEEDLYVPPSWTEETIWYQIFPERFCNGTPTDGRDLLPWGSEEYDGYDKKFGGNLEGIIEKLDYIKDMGFNGIYLTPIFESPSSHKYDTTNYHKIDPEFGDNKTFARLVDEAHKRGIRVMLDAVFNHCGFYHPYWQDVIKNGKESPYYDCFYILNPDKPLVQGMDKSGVPGDCNREDLNYRTFAYSQYMPKWNTGNPTAREYLIDVACYWIQNYEIDGWRLDVSNEVSHDFWREFRKRIKELNKEAYIIGENWDNSYPWLQGDQFDAVMNYAFSIPAWNFFRKDDKGGVKYNSKMFQHAISNLLTMYPKHLTRNLFNLLDSHDTERILHVAGEEIDIVKLAYIFLLTFPGSPCIYYGSEIGMSGGEHSNRQCMIWAEDKQNLQLSEFVKRLIMLRKEHDSFKTENLNWIPLDIDTNTLLYKKQSYHETLYVFIHNEPNNVHIMLPEEMRNKSYIDLINNKSVSFADRIMLDSFGYKIVLETR